MSQKYKWIIAAVIVLGIVVIAQASASTTIYMPLFYMPSTLTPTPTKTPTPTATPKPGDCISGVFPVSGVKVCFTKIDYKPTTSPLDEYVDIKNTGSSKVDMTGWRIVNDSSEKYDLPAGYELSTGQTVRVFTKSGKNEALKLYMNRTVEFWKDNRDCAYLKDDDDPRGTVNAFCYGSTGFTAAPDK